MQIETRKRMPQNLKKKAEREQKLAEERTATEATQAQQRKQLAEYSYAQGKKHWESFKKQQSDLVDLQRQAKANGELYVPDQPKFLLVVRIKGINKVAPKERKILQLLRLRQLHNAVLVKNNVAVMNMVRRVDAYVTYGYPSHRVLRALLYKRGYGKINKQRIPITDNAVVEKGLGEHGIKCVEDLLNELWTFGPKFKEANNFLWPFKLDSPKGGFKAKRHQYMDNRGDQGPRDIFINRLVERML